MQAALLQVPTPDPLPVPPLERAFDVEIRPPGSKSLTNRLLLLAGLSRGRSVIRHALTDAIDARRMIEALETLGANVTPIEGGLDVLGVDGTWPASHVRIDLHNAGTATRFLAAASVLAQGPVTIDGNERMRARPIGELAEAIERLGATIEYGGSAGCPPLTIVPGDRPKAMQLGLGTTRSSQFISALLMLGPWVEGGITVRLSGEITSPTYIDMTVELLYRLGATVQLSDNRRVIRVGPSMCEDGSGPDAPGLRGFEIDVEPDASGATYFWGAAAMVEGARCVIPGLGTSSIQGDAAFVTLLRSMGAEVDRRADVTTVTGTEALTGIDADLSLMPDAAMTLGVLACYATGPTSITGLRTLRDKECDRLDAMRNEFTKLGAGVETTADAIRITPAPPREDRVELDTYDDHRMAMSLALAGLKRPGVLIRDPACVNKTYPGFWSDLAALYG